MIETLAQLVDRLWTHRSNHVDGRAPDEGERGPQYAWGEFDDRLPPQAEIIRFIEENGGVVWQGDITSAVDWSASTTSRRVSELEEHGHVNRFQIGRQKMVCLPGHEPEFLQGNDDRPVITTASE